MLNKIKNAQAVAHLTTEVPFSNLKYEVAKILEKNGFIEKAEKKGRKAKKTIEIVLKYNDKTPAISGLKIISKPGRRVYLDSSRIKKIKDGYGMAIISASKGGIITDKEARKQKVGGEIICEIW